MHRVVIVMSAIPPKNGIGAGFVNGHGFVKKDEKKTKDMRRVPWREGFILNIPANIPRVPMCIFSEVWHALTATKSRPRQL